jgi:hypothetical protein
MDDVLEWGDHHPRAGTMRRLPWRTTLLAPRECHGALHGDVEEVGVVQDQHETYRGRSIVVRQQRTDATAEPGAEGAAPELYIDDELVFTVRDSAGMYIAAGLAYDPQRSLVELGKRIVDYREALR